MTQDVREVLNKVRTDDFDDDAPFLESLVYKNIFIPTFARDIVLFGKEHGQSILEQYGLDVSDLATIIDMPVFKAEVKNLRKLMDEGVLITTQMRAAAALEGAVDVLAEKLADPSIKPTDAVAITKELKALATMTHTSVFRKGLAEGDAPTSAAGMTINFSFGDPSQLPPVQENRIINVTPTRDEKLANLLEAEEVEP